MVLNRKKVIENFETLISNQVIPRLDSYRLGDEFQKSVDDAFKCGNIDTWINQEKRKVGVAGALEMAIPIAGLAAGAVGIVYLFHHLARISWGCGALLGARPIEDEEYSDIQNILTVWSIGTYARIDEMQSRAVDIGVITYFATNEGRRHALQLMERAELDGDMQLLNTLKIAQKYSGSIESISSAAITQQAAVQAVQASMARFATNMTKGAVEEQVMESAGKAASRTAGKIIGKAGTRSAGRAARKSAGKVFGRAVIKRLAIKLGSKYGARVFSAMIPIAGAIINSTLNVQTLNSMKNIAIEYYNDRLMRDDLDEL